MGRDTVPGFAAAVRRIREEKGLSIDDLAEAASTSRDSVSRIEREDRAPSLRLALALARALGASLDVMCVSTPAAPEKRGRGRPKKPD